MVKVSRGEKNEIDQETDLCQSQNESDNKKPKCIWTNEHGCAEMSPGKLCLFLGA